MGARKPKETAKRVVGEQVKCLPTTLLNDSFNEVLHDSDNIEELDCIKNALNVYLGDVNVIGQAVFQQMFQHQLHLAPMHQSGFLGIFP